MPRATRARRSDRRPTRTRATAVYVTTTRLDTNFDGGVIGAHDNVMLEFEERWQNQTANDSYQFYTGHLVLLGTHTSVGAACGAVATLLHDFPAPWQLLRCQRLLASTSAENDFEDGSVPARFAGYHPEVLPRGGDWWFPQNPRPGRVPPGHTALAHTYYVWCALCVSYTCQYAR